MLQLVRRNHCTRFYKHLWNTYHKKVYLKW